MTMPVKTQLRMRFLVENVVALGPGKVDLLNSIHDKGSISKAAQSLQMSYKRAWNLIQEMNSIFNEPLVITNKGGEKGGGASLSDAGQKVCLIYRELEDQFLIQQKSKIAKITAMLSDNS